MESQKDTITQDLSNLKQSLNALVKVVDLLERRLAFLENDVYTKETEVSLIEISAVLNQ